MQKKREVPAGVWDNCQACGHMIYRKEVEANLHCCSDTVGYHLDWNATTRVFQFCGNLLQIAFDTR